MILLSGDGAIIVFRLGMSFLLIAFCCNFFRPLDFLGTVYRPGQTRSLTDMAAVFRLIDTKATLEDKAHAPALQIKTGELRFEHVQFQYHADRPILGISILSSPLVKAWLLLVLPVPENQL